VAPQAFDLGHADKPLCANRGAGAVVFVVSSSAVFAVMNRDDTPHPRPLVMLRAAA